MLTTPSTIAHAHPAYQALNNFVKKAFSPQGASSGELQAVIDQSRPGDSEQGRSSPTQGMIASSREVTESSGLSNAIAPQSYTQRIWSDKANLTEATQIATSVIEREKDGVNETYMWLFRNLNKSQKLWTAIEGKLYNDHRANGFNKPVLRLEAWQGTLKSVDNPKKAIDVSKKDSDVSKKDSEVLSFIFGRELTAEQKAVVIAHHKTAKASFFDGKSIDDSPVEFNYDPKATVQAIKQSREYNLKKPGITLTNRHHKTIFFPLEAVCNPENKHILGSRPFRSLLEVLGFDFSTNETAALTAAQNLTFPSTGAVISQDEWKKRQKQKLSIEAQINFYHAQKETPNYQTVIADPHRVHALLKKAQLHPGALLLDFDASNTSPKK